MRNYTGETGTVGQSVAQYGYFRVSGGLLCSDHEESDCAVAR